MSEDGRGGGVYRVELAKTGRAVCSATHCKKEGVKIEKGVLRQGVQVTFRDYTSMKWRHWGCVTPAVLRNWKETSQMDMELVDGYDILPDDLQEKVKRALDQEHVDDDDWNGDQEMNRFNPAAPRQGMFVKTPKPKKDWSEEDDDDNFEDDSPIKKKASKKRSRVEQDEDGADEPPKPAPKKSKSKAKAAANEEVDEAEAAPPKPKAHGKKAKAETEDADIEPVPAKKSKSKKAKPSEDIPSSQTFVADDEPATSKKSRSKKAASEEAAPDVEDDAPKTRKRRGRPKKTAAEDD